ncbi:MAG: hypothetical protein Q8P31_11590 [Bacillota bacterium]|nr:hypothetical protein [Bacillota bacterium]
MQSKQVPVIVVFCIATLMLLDYFFPGSPLKPAAAEVLRWSLILSAVAMTLGAVNLVRINAKKILRRQHDWYNSVLMFVGLALFTAVGVYGGGPNYPLYARMFQTILASFSQAFWGVVLFFIVSAAYRGFVVRNWQATIILVSAIVIMLGQVPVGDVLIPGVGKVAVWLRDVPNLAGQRGIIIGAAVGAITQQLRVMLGLERAQFGG